MNNKPEPAQISYTENVYLCMNCGGHDPDGNRIGGTDLLVFELRDGNTTKVILTYCKDCAEKLALFLLRSWK